MKKYLLLVISIILLCSCTKEYKLYTSELKYLDDNIKITFYSSNKDKSKKALKEIDSIYYKYNKAYNNINKRIINSNLEKEIINYGKKWYKESNYYVSINTKNFIENEKNNISNKNYDFSKYNNKNYNVSFYIKGMASNEVYNYLKEVGIKKYLITTKDSVLAGLSNDNSKYNIALASPFDDGIKMLSVNNKYIVTKSLYDNPIEIDGIKYSNIVNAKKRILQRNHIAVSVITNDVGIGDMLASTLLVMDYNVGKEFIKNYDAKAIWYYIDNEKEITKESERLYEY